MAAPAKAQSTTLTLDTPVQYLKYVGPYVADLLSKRGVKTARDLLYYFPLRYVDRRTLYNVESLPIEKKQTLLATVTDMNVRPLGRSRKKILEILLKDDTGYAKAVFFNFREAAFKKRFPAGTTVTAFGDVTRYGAFKQMAHPELEEWDDEAGAGTGILPFYPLTEGLHQKTARRIVKANLESLLALIEDDPRSVRESGEVAVSLVQALRAVHEPPSDVDLGALNNQTSVYHQRIVYDEFFFFELAMIARRAAMERGCAAVIKPLGELAGRVREKLPFKLTDGQESALAEISADFASGLPMNRLLQGDVGCGKTLVAFLSALWAIEAGGQAAIMVPTEILAEQHFKNLVRYEIDVGFRMELLTSATPDKKRITILQGLASGEINLVVGTHALITPDVAFKNLVYVVVDEQHRFGVVQRAQLRAKASDSKSEPHVLFMTATPIPRTLSMSLYGDLYVSIIAHRPEGRKPITTRVIYEKKRAQAYAFVQDELKKGRQAYFIYPLVEESEKLDLKNATLMHAELTKEFEGYGVGLLHGRMKSAEKEGIMGRFKSGELSVLVATTVVEVGVDVPNASVIVIEHAERFGLSQLHQLRGRVGRGAEQSHCVLMAGYAQSEESRFRLRVMEESNDGFFIAEEDLKLRGPGDFLGTKQSGLPDFHLAHLVRDGHLLQVARKRAEEILHADSTLSHVANAQLRLILHTRWRDRLDLAKA